MIQVVPHLRIFVARTPLDFRKRMDGTAAVCRNILGHDPLTGAMFVFRNRSSTMVRALIYDGQGLWLMTKRLSKGRFQFWPEPSGDPALPIAAHQLHTLFAGGKWQPKNAMDDWRPVSLVR